MREKTLCTIVTFLTPTDAMAFECFAGQHDLPGRLIPVPSAVSAGCGICWCAPHEEAGALGALKAANTLAIETIYTLLI